MSERQKVTKENTTQEQWMAHRERLATIHIYKQDVDMNDGDYRAFLTKHGGCSSSSMMTEDEHNAVIEAFQELYPDELGIVEEEVADDLLTMPINGMTDQEFIDGLPIM